MKIRMMQFTQRRIAWLSLAGVLAICLVTVPLMAYIRPQASSATAGRPHNDPVVALRPDLADMDHLPSIYDLTLPWHDQDGTPRQLSDLRGTVWVLALVYTHCATTCPTIVQSMKRVTDRIPANQRDNVKFVLISLDPERDTPKRLRDYAHMMNLPLERWRLLNGSDDAVRELAAALGVRYQRLSLDEIAHSNIVTVFDRRGRVAIQSVGGADDTDVVRVLRSLLRNEQWSA